MLPTGITATKVVVGPSASDAGKSVTESFIAGGVKVIVFGLNQNAMKTGIVAIVTAQAADSAVKKSYVISVTNVVASDASGANVPMTATPGTLTIQ
jgi:hypothetical protein